MNEINQIKASKEFNNLKSINGYNYRELFNQIYKIFYNNFELEFDKDKVYNSILEVSANNFKINFDKINTNQQLNQIIESINFKLFTKEFLSQSFKTFITRLNNFLHIRLSVTSAKELTDIIISSLSFPGFYMEMINKKVINIVLNRLRKNINSSLNDTPDYWYKLTDKDCPIGKEKDSHVEPYYFSYLRTSAVVCLDDIVLTDDTGAKTHTDLINDYRQQYFANNEREFSNILEEFGASNLAMASAFNNVVLIEYVTDKVDEHFSIEDGSMIPINGNLQLIVNALKKHGFKKIFIQTKAPWIGTLYKREAKLLKKLNR